MLTLITVVKARVCLMCAHYYLTAQRMPLFFRRTALYCSNNMDNCKTSDMGLVICISTQVCDFVPLWTKLPDIHGTERHISCCISSILSQTGCPAATRLASATAQYITGDRHLVLLPSSLDHLAVVILRLLHSHYSLPF